MGVEFSTRIVFVLSSPDVDVFAEAKINDTPVFFLLPSSSHSSRIIASVKSDGNSFSGVK